MVAGNRGGRPRIEVPEGTRWCSYHQSPHPLGEFAGAERTCREGKTYLHVKRAYGLTPEEYDSMRANVCPICEKRAVKYVDHCHQTDNVRGMLCPPCNSALGAFNDDPKVFMRALDYLGLV